MKQRKRILALLAALVSLLSVTAAANEETEAPADEPETTAEPAVEPEADDVAETIPETSAEPTAAPTAVPAPTAAPQAAEALEPDFTVEIEIADPKSVYDLGDELTLMGNLSGLENISYTLCWEYCDNDKDEWAAAPGENGRETYTYQLTEENADWAWRLAVIL